MDKLPKRRQLQRDCDKLAVRRDTSDFVILDYFRKNSHGGEYAIGHIKIYRDTSKTAEVVIY